MAEYISKEWLVNQIKPPQDGDVQCAVLMSDIRKIFVDFILSAPTVDAEVVIRCEDCEYYKDDECHCPYILVSDGACIYPYENDFCSYAEPKARDEE